MKVARYIGNGEVSIVEEDAPICPPGGLLVRTEACGLCSGELMSWYMDKKIPHVLGHEVAGIVTESQDERFAVGTRVFPHHHAPCLHCELCAGGRYVHCDQWRRTKLSPGGMAESFAVSAQNLSDTLAVDDLRAIDAALIEPLACVMKSIARAPKSGSAAVIGLGVMGLMHMLALGEGAIGYELNEHRRNSAAALGLDARSPENIQTANRIFVCPGSQKAFDFALEIANPGATIVMFAPLAPGDALQMPQSAYFKDLQIQNTYSCGPDDTIAARDLIRNGTVRAEQVVSDFISIDELPEHYVEMKSGRILKPMVVF